VELFWLRDLGEVVKKFVHFAVVRETLDNLCYSPNFDWGPKRMAPARRGSRRGNDVVEKVEKTSGARFKAKEEEDRSLETIRQKNIEERKKMFEEMKLGEAANVSFAETISPLTFWPAM